MVPQLSKRDREKDEDGPIQLLQHDKDKPSSSVMVYGPPTITPPSVPDGDPTSEIMYGPPWKTADYPNSLRPPVGPPVVPLSKGVYASTGSSSSRVPAWSEGGTPLPSSTTSCITDQTSSTFPTSEGADFAGRGPGWEWRSKEHNRVPLYAVAALIPIVLLVIIGAVVFICLRRRKRLQKSNANAASLPAREMVKRTRTSMHQYMAQPQPTVASQYMDNDSQLPPTSTPSQLQPVILGPIPSGLNGAYLTGIDTSDMVSITSDNVRRTEQFTDNSSLAESTLR